MSADDDAKHEKLIRDCCDVDDDGSLDNESGSFLFISYEAGDSDIRLEGTFYVEQLEAMVWWIRKHEEESHRDVSDAAVSNADETTITEQMEAAGLKELLEYIPEDGGGIDVVKRIYLAMLSARPHQGQ